MNFDIRYTGISQKSWNSATYSDGTDTTLPMTAVAMQTASPVIIVIISTAMLVFVTCFILSQRVKTESSAFADFLETMPGNKELTNRIADGIIEKRGDRIYEALPVFAF